MPKLNIDGKDIEVNDGTTLIQACEAANVEIPRFCYHEKLAIAGNCRMCLVELEKSPKLVASCAMPVAEGMVVKTNSKKVEDARKGVMEFLLINHPLDCPICDQGGECDLQDQSYKYGKANSRYEAKKRAIEDKDFGPLIKTHMTRCIQCTRCIRFAEDVAGTNDLGAIDRGEEMKVVSYIEGMLDSEISGNIIDLCPVGALTSKPYSFKARNWDLTKTESIDVLDSICSNIRIDSKPFEVMRILPKRNDAINEEWISDKTRFAYDGLKYQRLDSAYIRNKGKLEKVDLEFAVIKLVEKLQEYKPNEIAAVSGLLSDCESILMLKKIMSSLGTHNLSLMNSPFAIDQSSRQNYLFNTGIANIVKSDLVLLIGADIRNSLPILGARIRKAYLENNLKVYSIGKIKDQTFPVEYLGDDPQFIQEIANKKGRFAKILSKAKNPMIIVGGGIYQRKDSEAMISSIHDIIFSYSNFIRPDWNGFNVLHTNTGTINAIELGFAKKHINDIYQDVKSGKIKLVYLHGADELKDGAFDNIFVIYQGHHGDQGAEIADIILPGAAYTEKDATYINLEGKAQKAYRAIDPPGSAREDINILGMIMKEMGIADFPPTINKVQEEVIAYIDSSDNKIERFYSTKKLLKKPIKVRENNFYMTDVISKNSINMSRAWNLKLQ